MTAGIVFYAIAMAVAAFDRDDGYAPPLVIATIVLFLWMMGWNSAIRFTASHLFITNFLVTSTVDWRDVTQVTAGDGLNIQLRDGRDIGSIAFGGSVIGVFTGYPTHQRARRLLEDAHLNAIRSRKRMGPVHLRSSLEWRRPLVAAAVVYLPPLIARAIGG